LVTQISPSTENPQPPDGAPAFARAQRDEILQLLRDAGPDGVAKSFLLFEKHFSQAASRVFELEKLGYQIRHESREGSRYVYFVLVGEPPSAPAKPLEQQPDGGTLPLCDALEGRD
jgi:hypothetical protein